MTTLTTALNAEFTPAVGNFNVQCTGGVATLQRKNSAGAAFAPCGAVDGARVVYNDVADAVYRFVDFSGTPAVQADQ
jgi:hypothetical protein